ncbi:hypothetical protein ACWGDT_31505 [Streptomyces avermitilis]
MNAGDADIAELVLSLTDGSDADGVVETTGSVAVLSKGADALAPRAPWSSSMPRPSVSKSLRSGWPRADGSRCTA